MSKLTDKQKNFNNFIQIVQNEFPRALRQVFETMWNQTYQPWDDSPTVRSIFLSLEGVKTKIPFHLSYEEWDTTSLLLATLYSRAFSVQGYGAGHTVTLSDMYVRPRKLPLGSFHATVLSPTGNRLETIALAIDQLRLLRNTSAHWRGEAEMEKPMFDQYYFILGTWAIVERIGGGGFGEVHKLVNCLTRTVIAVKIVEIDPSKKEHLRQLENEIKILTDLRHERIVSCYGGEQKDDHLYLFMAYMAEGSLADLVKKRGALDERLSSKYAKQILEGAHYLHSNDIIHRDIKGPNILLDGDGNLKLADFGLARTTEKVGSKTSLTTVCGTWNWMAPEVVRGETYGRVADIWSVGCTVLEMLTGGPPLKSFEQQQVIFKIGSDPTQPKLPEGIPQAALEFLKATLARKPSERPSSEELLTYKFITEEQENE